MTTIINASVPSLRAGPEGKQGIQGGLGEQGEKGDQGIQGEIGPQGEKGDTGAGGGINGITSVTEGGESEQITTITVDVGWSGSFAVNGTIDFTNTRVDNLQLHSRYIGPKSAQNIGLTNPVTTTSNGKKIITCDVQADFLVGISDNTYQGIRTFGWLQYLLPATEFDASKVNYHLVYGQHFLGYRCGIQFLDQGDGFIKAELKKRTNTQAADVRYDISDGSNFNHDLAPFMNKTTIMVDAISYNDFVTHDYLRLLEKQITALTARIDNM